MTHVSNDIGKEHDFFDDTASLLLNDILKKYGDKYLQEKMNIYGNTKDAIYVTAEKIIANK